jgi:1-acyl-sn-glycerol-3-phosphate acyltransferase
MNNERETSTASWFEYFHLKKYNFNLSGGKGDKMWHRELFSFFVILHLAFFLSYRIIFAESLPEDDPVGNVLLGHFTH